MPIFVDIVNLVFDKEIVSKKYKGGIEQFRKDFIVDSEINKEDKELFALGQRDYGCFSWQKLAENGFSEEYIDKQKDGVHIVLRYGDELKSDWLKTNGTFFWHKDCDKEKLHKVNLTIGGVNEMFDKGLNPFETIY